ncbi:MAG: hypothetical protein QGG48_12900 [Desulfatiglandales bacterium]|nr:hypothetical protein [Desulfatiglandales bacterium]
MNMVYPFFAIYILVGLAISLVVGGWAVKKGQFKEQQRARFLPLEDEPETGGEVTDASPYEIYALWILAVVGLLISGAVLIFSLFTGGR